MKTGIKNVAEAKTKFKGVEWASLGQGIQEIITEFRWGNLENFHLRNRGVD
jgi:hypothetical protein